MRIRRSRLTTDYVQIPNGTVRDDRLSYMARGILGELLSRPDGWEDTADNMWRRTAEARGAKGEGRRAFRAAFAELKEHGYLVAEREQLSGGKHATVLTAYDIPAGRTDVPHGGTSGNLQSGIPAGRTDMPHAGTPETTEVPHAGTSASPGQIAIPAGRTDVPLSDVPHAGTSNRRRSKNTPAYYPPEPQNGQAGKAGGPLIPDWAQPLIDELEMKGIVVGWKRGMTPLRWVQLQQLMHSHGTTYLIHLAGLRWQPDNPIKFSTLLIDIWQEYPPPKHGSPWHPEARGSSQPEPRPLPDWCGHCDAPDYRWLERDGREYRCPTCNPDAIGAHT